MLLAFSAGSYLTKLRLAAVLLLAGAASACNQTTKSETAITTQRETAAPQPTPPTALAKPAGWWKETVVYQLSPRSFQDNDGDGVGDLKGIISRLDYLKNIVVGTVWLNPIYASPKDDNDYDISNYRQIMPEFGTMAEFSSAAQRWPLPAGLSPSGAPWLNNYPGAAPSGPALALQPW